MHQTPLSLLRAAGLTLALPLLGVSAAIQINSTCYGPGSCSNPANLTDSVTYGNTIAGSQTNNITIGTDTYRVTNVYSTSYGDAGSAITVLPTVTYTGSSPAATAETITINFLQDIYDNSPGNYDGTYEETIPLSVPTDATASAELFVDGQGIGLVGPYGPGSYSVSKSAGLTGLDSAYLAFDYQFTFSFAAGLPPGSTGSSPNPSAAPEPAQTIPAGLGLVGLTLAAFRRRNTKEAA
jgi:MYXO-CTERM domain-containing protein